MREKAYSHLWFISLQPSPAADRPKFNSSACSCASPNSWFGWRSLSFLNLSASATSLLWLLPLPTFSSQKLHVGLTTLLEIDSSVFHPPLSSHLSFSFPFSYSAEFTECLRWELNYTANSSQVPVSQCGITAKIQITYLQASPLRFSLKEAVLAYVPKLSKSRNPWQGALIAASTVVTFYQQELSQQTMSFQLP